jgi:hypothetical protein
MSLGVPLSALESSTCSHLWNETCSGVRSMRSDYGRFGREFETKADAPRHSFAGLKIDSSIVAGGDSRPGVGA